MSATYITIQQFCAFHQVDVIVIEEFIDYGILEVTSGQEGIVAIPETQLPRLERALRLREELGINAPGIDVILRLLDRLHNRDGVEDL